MTAAVASAGACFSCMLASQRQVPCPVNQRPAGETDFTLLDRIGREARSNQMRRFLSAKQHTEWSRWWGGMRERGENQGHSGQTAYPVLSFSGPHAETPHGKRNSPTEYKANAGFASRNAWPILPHLGSSKDEYLEDTAINPRCRHAREHPTARNKTPAR